MEFNRYLVGTMLFFLSKSYENNLSMFIMFKLREQQEYVYYVYAMRTTGVCLLCLSYKNNSSMFSMFKLQEQQEYVYYV